jgi:hypothetical protein
MTDPHLVFVRGADVLALNGIEGSGSGIEAGPGATGFGAPPVSVQWAEGAGHGSVYRRTRVLPRDIDLPLQIAARDRDGLGRWVSRLASFLAAGPFSMRWVLPDGEHWALGVVYTGGGDWGIGDESGGETWLKTTITLRAPDPWWIYSRSEQVTLAPPAPASVGRLRPQALGEDFGVANTGDAPAPPVWSITGPATEVRVTDTHGRGFTWSGDLAAGERLTVDTKARTVTDQTGASRYRDLEARPDFFTLPPGASRLRVDIDGAGTDTRAAIWWRRRRWAVV